MLSSMLGLDGRVARRGVGSFQHHHYMDDLAIVEKVETTVNEFAGHWPVVDYEVLPLTLLELPCTWSCGIVFTMLSPILATLLPPVLCSITAPPTTTSNQDFVVSPNRRVGSWG